MKKIFLSLLAAGLVASCQTDPKTVIRGHVTGVESDSLFVRYGTYGSRDFAQDTIPMKQGSFRMTLPESRLQELLIWPVSAINPDGSRQAVSMNPVRLPLLPGQTVEVEGSLDALRLAGSPFYEELQQFLDQIAPINEKQKQISELRHQQAQQQELAMRSLSIEKSYKTFEYIKEHPDSDVSVWLLTTLSSKQAQEAFALITPRAQQGMLGEIFHAVKQRVEREQKRRQAAATVIEGSMAPEFKVTTLDGKELTLSSLRGKPVVLDFWGTWCGWCIKGMPEMKAIYEKYRGRLEFVGIACNDKEDRWKASVKEQALPWIHTLNTEAADLSILYGVSGFPTKFILDAEGRIVKKVMGESPEFYEALDQLMK